MAYKSLSKHLEIADSGTDRKNSVRVGKYHVGPEALYIPCFPRDKYIPKAAIKLVRAKKSTLSVGGCCGVGIPVVVIAIDYYIDKDTVEMVKLTLDNQKEADKMLELLEGCEIILLS